MPTVQVAVSFAVELWKFHNIDLFHQGAFQIRSYFKTNGLAPVIIEAPKIWNRSRIPNFSECISSNYISEPDSKTNTPTKAVSKTVVIIYKEESLKLYDVMEQTMHFQIEASAIDETIYKSDITLVVELWFGEKKNEVFDEVKCVCERQLKVHFRPSQGLHHHSTVMFDYYYLAATELVIHASLVSISPCYLRMPYNPPNGSTNSLNNGTNSESYFNVDKNCSMFQSWHSILFNTGKSIGKRHTACLIHTQLCKLLLTVIENLILVFRNALSFFADKQRSAIENKLNVQLCPLLKQSDAWLKFAPNELERMSSILQAQTCEEDMADQASIDITKLSSRILVLFYEFLRTTCFQSGYIESLSVKTHKLRIKRFSEAFFFQESPVVHLLAVYDPNAPSSHEALAARIRNSPYYKRLPPLPVECPETDGQSHDQPIIFEEIFRPESMPSPLFFTTNENNQSSGKKKGASENVSENQKSRSSLYQKRKNVFPSVQAQKSGLPQSIPVIRKLNPNYKNKDSPLADQGKKGVNLVGFRSIESQAFSEWSASGSPAVQKSKDDGTVDNNRKESQNSQQYQIRQEKGDALAAKQGLGTLQLLNGYHRQNNANQSAVGINSLSISSPSLSRSMPDLSFIDDKAQLRRKFPGRLGSSTNSGKKNRYHRFSSIYELEDAQPLWVCDSNQHARLSRSQCALFANPAKDNDAGDNDDRTAADVHSSKKGVQMRLHSKEASFSTNKDQVDQSCFETENNADNNVEDVDNNRSITSANDIEASSTDTGDGAGEGCQEEQSITLMEMLSTKRPSSVFVENSIIRRDPAKNLSENDNAAKQKRLSLQNSSVASMDFNSNLTNKQTAAAASPSKMSLVASSTTSINNSNTLTFGRLKAALMTELKPHFRSCHVYSDLADLPAASQRPYFSLRDNSDNVSSSALSVATNKGMHYVICVHGLEGEHRDLRLVRTFLSLALPEERLEFLMSEWNEGATFGDIKGMVNRLVDEVIEKMSQLSEKPEKISFIGHSLGCILVRGAVAHPKFEHNRSKLHTFLSLGGPHLGTLFGSSVLVNMGLWFMQKLKKSLCLQQLSLKDNNSLSSSSNTSLVALSTDSVNSSTSSNSSGNNNQPVDPRQTLLYRLSDQPSLELFRYVLLAGSPQDRYVPFHSTRIELCRASVRDNSELGIVYMEMVTKLLQRVLQSGNTTVVRFDAHYTLARSANNYIGRAAHIALIDSELFLEKFISVSAAKYFR